MMHLYRMFDEETRMIISLCKKADYCEKMNLPTTPAMKLACHTITDDEINLKYLLSDKVYNSIIKAATIVGPGYD